MTFAFDHPIASTAFARSPWTVSVSQATYPQIASDQSVETDAMPLMDSAKTQENVGAVLDGRV